MKTTKELLEYQLDFLNKTDLNDLSLSELISITYVIGIYNEKYNNNENIDDLKKHIYNYKDWIRLILINN